MSSQSRQHQNQSDQSTSLAVDNAVVQGGRGNSANAEKARTEEGTAAGLANYQATLGQWLGTQLYQAIAPELTLERLSGHANAGFTAAIDAALGSVDTNGQISDDAIAKLSESLKKEYGTIAGDWLNENGAGLTKRLGDWVDANPLWIVTSALLAAAGAIIANASIPELKKKFKLGDNISGSVGANIGKLRDISLKSISAELEWATGPLLTAMKMSHSEGQTDTTVTASAGTEQYNLTAEGQFVDTSLQLLNLQGVIRAGDTTMTAEAEHSAEKGGTNTLTADITTENGGTTRTNNLTYDPDTGAITVGNILKIVQDGTETTVKETSKSDGSQLTSMSFSGDVSDTTKLNFTLEESAQMLGATTSYGLTQTQRAEFGLDYSAKDLDAAMTLGLDSQGNGSMGGNLDLSLDSGWTAGADTKLKWGNTDYLEAGAYFGFRNPDEFQTYMTRYRFKSGDETTHELDILIEEKFGPVYTRLQQQVAHSAGGMRFQTTAQGAYFLNEDIALIGGAQYNQNEMGEGSFAPQLGAQIYGVPLVVTHDMDTNTTTLGITMRFGGRKKR